MTQLSEKLEANDKLVASKRSEAKELVHRNLFLRNRIGLTQRIASVCRISYELEVLNDQIKDFVEIYRQKGETDDEILEDLTLFKMFDNMLMDFENTMQSMRGVHPLHN